METETNGSISPAVGDAIRKPSRRIEFFWLCDDCASRMTLSFKPGTGMTITPLGRSRGAAS